MRMVILVPDFYIDENQANDDTVVDGQSWANAFSNSKGFLDNASTSAGNEIWYASDHYYAYPNLGNINLPFPDDCTLLSIDKADDSLLAGAKEFVGNADNLLISTTNIGKSLYIDGVSFDCDDEFSFNKSEMRTSIRNLTIGLTSTAGTDALTLAYTDGMVTDCHNVNFNFSFAGQRIKIINGSKVNIDGGSVNSTCTVLVDLGGNGGAHIKVKNFDASAMTTGVLVNSLSSADDVVSAEFSRVKKNTNVDIYSGVIASPAQTIDAWSIDNGGGYHYFEHHRFTGVVKENTTVKRAAWYYGDTYNSTYGFSAKFMPNSNAVEFTQPLNIMIKTPELDLSGGAVTLTIHILLQDSVGTPVSLTDMNCILKAVYPDGTTTA